MIIEVRIIDSSNCTNVIDSLFQAEVVKGVFNKTFFIDNPLDNDKYLVHGCLEGPEIGVYYRGVSEIINNNIQIILPQYVSSIASEFSIHVTPYYNGKLRLLNCTEIIDNKFNVYGDPGKFSWIVHGLRSSINDQPLKSDYSVKGDGPYKYLTKL